jgi:hypothetical protein
MSDSPLHSTYPASSGVAFFWGRKPLYLVGFGQELNGESL